MVDRNGGKDHRLGGLPSRVPRAFHVSNAASLARLPAPSRRGRSGTGVERGMRLLGALLGQGSHAVTEPPPYAARADLRWRVPLILLVTMFVNFLDRLNLSLTLPAVAAEFGWSAQQIGSNGGWACSTSVNR